MSTVPFKANAARRHRIPRQRHRVTNWAAYDAALRQRGSLTVWFTEEAVAAWRAEPRTTRGGQPRYSPLAILTALTLRAVFRLAFRQTEGLIGSVVGLLGLALRVPDHTRTGYPVHGGRTSPATGQGNSGRGELGATPVAPGARCPERSRWRCGAAAEHGEASPP